MHSSFGDRLMSLLEKSVHQQPDRLQVLTYHRILNPHGFDRQMAYLAAKYHVISMPELLDARRDGDELPSGSVMVTFDDAYLDFADCAWPIMKRYQLPATLFVPTAFPDHPQRIFWWDRLQHALEHTPRHSVLNTPAGRFSLETPNLRMKAYRSIRDHLKTLPYSETLSWTHQICNELDASPAPHRVLGWEALRQLAEEGVTLGAHTRHHRPLNQLSPEEVKEEVRGSLQDIERESGAVLPIFAYPDGRFSDEVVEAVKCAGIDMAFTTIRGSNDIKHTDKLRLRRINIGPRATLPVLRAWLLHATLSPNW